MTPSALGRDPASGRICVIGRNVARPALRDLRYSIQRWPTLSSSTTTWARRPPAAVSQAVAYSRSRPELADGAVDAVLAGVENRRHRPADEESPSFAGLRL